MGKKINKIKPGMEIGCILSDRTIFITKTDPVGERLRWRGGDDKVFIHFESTCDFTMIAEMLAYTHGLGIRWIDTSNDNIHIYQFIK